MTVHKHTIKRPLPIRNPAPWWKRSDINITFGQNYCYCNKSLLLSQEVAIAISKSRYRYLEKSLLLYQQVAITISPSHYCYLNKLT